MAELKTQPNDRDVEAYLNSVEDERKRADSFRIVQIMREETGAEPQMWGDSIVGFGSYHYVHPGGSEGDWFLTGFAPRKQNLTLYIMSGFDNYAALLDNLGKHKTGKACLYIKRLSDIDEGVLRELIRESVSHMEDTEPR